MAGFINYTFVWAIIIALPVLAWEALTENWFGFIAAIPLMIAAVIGSMVMLVGTISRQAEYRDSAVVTVDSDDKKRVELEKRLLKNHAMLDEEYALKKKKCDTNSKFDCDEIKASIKVYQDAVEGVKRDLDKLGKFRKPLAGELRISEYVSMLWGYSKEDADKLVASNTPLLFGFFIELCAFATAIYGFHNMQLNTIETKLSKSSNPFDLKADRISFLEHQLTRTDLQSIDKRVLMHELDQAKRELINYIQKR